MSESFMGAQSAKVTCRAGKFLNFQLADELYGLELFKVKEIIGMMKVTCVPNSPPYMRGIVNLRGKVIPVIDLRVKFGMPPKEDTERTCIIVMQADRDGQLAITGIIVDEVCEVLDIKAEQIEPAPELGGQADAGVIQGIGKVAEKVILLLDSDRVLNEGLTVFPSE